ncbi:hypothetical protein AXG93_3005s1070 [Marchantia polymorpha subsp. ruderalis]|uniref:Uncharacterized protein n=1 Tax=Marchantia polymorpha subsp. ruderalis TaxID=1480154 RepID=A0A176WMV0_MARPO|nr:hypothetical protein AXG93_3005s1070 [Marchantia polymorpha subsp. ruderalis]
MGTTIVLLSYGEGDGSGPGLEKFVQGPDPPGPEDPGVGGKGEFDELDDGLPGGGRITDDGPGEATGVEFEGGLESGEPPGLEDDGGEPDGEDEGPDAGVEEETWGLDLEVLEMEQLDLGEKEVTDLEDFQKGEKEKYKFNLAQSSTETLNCDLNTLPEKRARDP